MVEHWWTAAIEYILYLPTVDVDELRDVIGWKRVCLCG